MMKQRLFYLFSTLFLPFLVWTKPVSPETALNLAQKHLELRSTHGTGSQGLQLHATQASVSIQRDFGNLERIALKTFENATTVNPPFHIITGSKGGFVIISGDDRAIPVIGSSLTGTIDPDNLPPSFIAWMQFYQRQIEAIVSNDGEPLAAVAAQWDRLSNGEPATTLETHAVNALIGTVWNQSPYYNNQCPYDNSAGERTLTGCVATAMAQIMNFWKHPTNGRGSSRYRHGEYGVQEANYESTQYNWSQMPRSLSSSSSSTQVDAVATLMYHCGVSVQMVYGVDGSGISDITRVSDSLRGYFDYGTTVSLVKRAETTDSIWISSLKNELNAGRPVFYVGYDPNGEGGHAWVCDGFDNQNRLHMNWGWGGQADGFFPISALIPVSDFNFTDHQMAVIGIAPQASSNQTTNLRLNSAISISPNPVQRGGALTVHFDVTNISDTSFSGTIAAGVFSSNNQLLLTLGSHEEADLGAGYHYSNGLTLTRDDTGSLQPGPYHVSVIYQQDPSGDWVRVSNGDYSNWVAFNISGADNELRLYAPIEIGSSNVIYQNTAFGLSFNILNSGSSNFNGAVEVDFYNMDGSYRDDVGTIYHYDVNGLGPNYYYSNNLKTTIGSGINLPPGEYLAAVTHRPSSGGDWKLTGSGDYSNPIRVYVQEGADIYEPNDDNFTFLNPHFVNNRATITTQYATIHSDDDLDLYWVSFDAGYDYKIDARIHDSWDSGNGKTYTTDVFMVILSSNDDVQIYDDIMDQPLRLNNGGYIAIGVGGWGYNLGTYDLEINAQRLSPGQLDPNDPQNYITPLYRFYRAGNDSHFFTANEAEKEAIIATQPADFWVYEGISQRVLHSQIPNAVPVYRMFNNISRSHFYTASQDELQVIQRNLGHVFSLEGVAFYALDKEVYNAKPVYRFFSTATASHFFTISKSERDQIIATIPQSKLRYEGVAWYAYP